MTGCYAKGCRNASAKGCKMSFFPKDPDRRATWIENCKKNSATTYTLPNRHAALCEFHFTADMWEKVRVDGTKKLKCSAIPTIFGDSVKQLEKDVEKPVKKKATVHSIPVQSVNKASSLQKILLCTNSNAKDLQILTQPTSGQQYMRIVPIKPEGSVAKKSKIGTDASKDSQKPVKIQPKPVAKQVLTLNNNAKSNKVQDSKPQNGTQQVQEHEISESHVIEEEDSDSDSFIANNFEPVSEDELLSKFEPVSDSEMIISDPDASDSDIQSAKVQAKIDATVTEENHLTMLEEKFKSACKSIKPCIRCEKLEKVYEKCNSLRIMMKKRNKANYNLMRRRIKLLENKVMRLQSSQHGLNKVFNEDQIDFLSRTQKKVWKWSETTLEKARLYKRKLGIKGYNLLLNDNWPLPSLRTLRSRGTKSNLEQLKIEANDYLDVEDSHDT